VKQFIKQNGLLLSLYLLILSVALYFILLYPKTETHLYLNQFVAGGVTDTFFYFITYFGDGRLAPVLLLLILFYNLRLGIAATASFLSASLFSNGLKYLFFGDIHRPFYVFQYIQKETLRYVEGIDLHIHNSFPSGHATQAFAILMLLGFFSRTNWLKVVFLLVAVFTAYSRIYISQHWLPDITAGSFIGTVFSCLWYYLFIGRDKLTSLNRPAFLSPAR
jgi:membrane-associated phospholipid phosphatase